MKLSTPAKVEMRSHKVVRGEEAAVTSEDPDVVDSEAPIGELDPDDVEFYIDDEPKHQPPVEELNLNADFDEKVELLEVPLSENISRKRSTDERNSIESVKTEYPLRSAPTFNLPDDHQPTVSFDLLDKLDFDERVVMQMNNVSCVCDLNRGLQYSKEVNVNVVGRLVLTNYRLQFIPYHPDDVIDLGKVFTIDRASNTSEKFKKVKYILESTTNPVIKDLLIKCKNFVTKQFTFNDYLRNAEIISKFVGNLIHYSNNQLVIQTRFHNLLGKMTSTSSSSSSSSTWRDSVDAAEKKKQLAGLMGMHDIACRKSYLLPTDLESDLVDSGCELFMQVKSGFVEVIPSRFIIDSNMPFCVFPKNLTELVTRRRVVTNESNVLEFNTEKPASEAVTPTTTSSKQSLSYKKSHRLSNFIMNSGSSSRSSSKSKPNPTIMQSYVSQDPILATLPSSNPFCDNRFPVWSYTDPNTLRSIIVVPESLPNRHDECEMILKNYNCFLADETTKLTKSRKQAVDELLRIGSSHYSDYEYVKLQIPFTSDKISTSYIRLLELCSYKSQPEFYKDNDSFYSRLQSTKWLRNVSTLLSFTSKIVTSINVNKRNVFLEEKRHNVDCSCILTSMAKICLNSKYRTIIGFENLVQKEWFLAGHLFNKRLYVSPGSSGHLGVATDDQTGNSRRTSIDSIDTQLTASSQSTIDERSCVITPTFLLFLDCLFQLVLQYPNEFEYNEIYLIHVWDLSLSGLSFTYSFNGVSDWLAYLTSQTTNSQESGAGIKSSLPKLDPSFISDLFNKNNHFWLSQFEANRASIVNGWFEASSNVLMPCEKIYMLKFWSRCYLRSIEKYHAYGLNESTVRSNPGREKEVSRNPRPPPLPPKPVLSQHDNELKPDGQKITIRGDEGKVIVTTTIKPDGSIESSF